MKLEDKSTKELLALHNAIADAPAGPKTFSTRAKLVARIQFIAGSKNIDLTARTLPGAAANSTPPEEAVGSPATTEAPSPPKKRGLGIGELARMLIMEPAGYPHSLIAAMVNAQISGATATDKSVRWYAAKMRKEGVQVPARHKAFPADMNEQQSKEWLASISVVKGSTE